MKLLLLSAALLSVSACVIVEPECEPAETRCMGDVLEICGEGWMPLNDCAADGLVCREVRGNLSCTNATTMPPVDAGPSRVCDPSELRCEQGILQRCAGNGLEWGADTNCNERGQTCVTTGQQACEPSPCMRGTDDEFRCTSLGVSQICAGVYATYADCDALGGVCASNGLCFRAEPCTNGEERCTNNMLERCTGDGWALRENCSITGQTCADNFEGRCEGPRTCITGEVQCSQNRVETCSEGTYEVTDDCAAQGKECRGNVCVEVACQSGSVTCDGDLASICEAGMIYERDCAAEGKVCSPIASRPCRDTCINNTGRCRGSTLEACQNGVYVVGMECANGCTYDDTGYAFCQP